MRIITGSARGRRLEAPEGLGTRPILDAQKETLFDVLGDRAKPDFVIDLFAGSGGLGLEALSRGAGSALFVERDREALQCLRRNIDHCGFSEKSRVAPIDAFRVALSDGAKPAGLVFVDAPFPCFRPGRERERLEALLAKIAAGPAVAPGATIVWRMPGEADPVAVPPGLAETDRREAGRSVIVLYGKTSQA
jgi:16S rRNA (guanine966-N2)-methyltransferase